MIALNPKLVSLTCAATNLEGEFSKPPLFLEDYVNVYYVDAMAFPATVGTGAVLRSYLIIINDIKGNSGVFVHFSKFYSQYERIKSDDWNWDHVVIPIPIGSLRDPNSNHPIGFEI